MAVKKSKSMDKLPARKMPESVKMPYKPSGKPKVETMPYKPSDKPKDKTMPYKPSSRGKTSSDPMPPEISKGEQTRRSKNQPSVDDKTSRTMSMAKKAATFRSAAGNPVAKPTAKTPAKTTKAPTKTTPKPKVTKKPQKMTPQDAAMKKILEGKYGKIYG
jgi:hypothetical protein